MLYFAMGYDGHLYNLSDCGDYEAADESATDLGIVQNVSVGIVTATQC